MNRLLTTMLVGLVTISTVAQTSTGRPKLVVGIVVDQLRTDYIEFLKEKFGERGFRRLIDHGIYAPDTDFGVANPDAASSTATIYTGAYPRESGVTGNRRYDPATLKSEATLRDASKTGRAADEAYNPEALRLSTLSDEIAIDGIGLGSIYSITTDPQMAVIMAGHAGTGAYWLSDITGRWTASDYYKAAPQPVALANRHPLAARIDTMQWRPVFPIDQYKGLPAQKSYYPFSHTFSTSDREAFTRFMRSPLANREVTDLAIDFLRTLKIGSTGSAIEMLNVGYTAAPYDYVKDGDCRFELQDAYIRLDAQIERLLDAIEQYVGLDNAVVFLSSTGHFDLTDAPDEKYRVPGGEFSAKRATSLLNAYLSARHGSADYIADLCDGQLYLDHKAIENSSLDPAEIAREARDFICRMSGVADAYTLSAINDATAGRTLRYRLGMCPATAGDVIIEVLPGWTMADDLHYPVSKTQVRHNAVLSPTFIMAPGVEAKTLSRPLKAVEIAPTVSSILRIRSPNGAAAKPLSDASLF